MLSPDFGTVEALSWISRVETYFRTKRTLPAQPTWIDLIDTSKIPYHKVAGAAGISLKRALDLNSRRMPSTANFVKLADLFRFPLEDILIVNDNHDRVCKNRSAKR